MPGLFGRTIKTSLRLDNSHATLVSFDKNIFKRGKSDFVKAVRPKLTTNSEQQPLINNDQPEPQPTEKIT